jgi:hypothetical protein
MKTFIASVFLTLVAAYPRAQNPNLDISITGIWKGTSLCQVKNSPCHDETVVYYITQVQGMDTFNIAANKIVNGKEEEMGVIGCKLDRKNNRLLSSSYNGLWTFNFKGKVLDGTLYHNGNLYRIIKLTKQQ